MSKKIIHNRGEFKTRRRLLRANQTRAEQLLWDRIRNRMFHGLKFRRQHSVGPFILDFYCVSLKLAIEVDGPTHLSDEAKAYDQHREDHIKNYNIHFLRFTNQEIYENLEGVLEVIWNWVQDLPQTPS